MARRERACERAGTLRPVLRRRGTRRGWGRAQRLPTHLVAGDHVFGIGVIFSGIGFLRFESDCGSRWFRVLRRQAVSATTRSVRAKTRTTAPIIA